MHFRSCPANYQQFRRFSSLAVASAVHGAYTIVHKKGGGGSFGQGATFLGVLGKQIVEPAAIGLHLLLKPLHGHPRPLDLIGLVR